MTDAKTEEQGAEGLSRGAGESGLHPDLGSGKASQRVTFKLRPGGGVKAQHGKGRGLGLGTSGSVVRAGAGSVPPAGQDLVSMALHCQVC